ncbi:MAG: hypothetical protein Q9213_006709 [Squamulea squamosa]
MTGTHSRPLAYSEVTALLLLILVSVSIANPLSFNASLSEETQPHCADDNDWNGGVVNPKDCLEALIKLESTDVKVYRTRDFEFLAPGARSRTSLDTIRLPRKYEVRTCTIVIAMLSSIAEDVLPGQERQVYEYGNTDKSKFSYLWSIAGWVDGACVVHKKLGWCATGINSNIGVFVVGTRSRMNRILSRIQLLDNSNQGAAITISQNR